MSEYIDVSETTTRTRYVAPEPINPDGTAMGDVSLIGWIISGVCLIAMIAIAFDILLSAV